MLTRSFKFVLFTVSLLLIMPIESSARTSAIHELQDMKLIGEARMRVLFWDVYDARLLSQMDRFDQSEPFALSLTYLRNFEGEKIAARSIEEMRKQGIDDEVALKRWYQSLVGIIPDVRENDEIVGLVDADGSARFFLGGAPIGEIREAAFTRAFFDIWLGDNTSEPRLRDQLLGVQR